MNPGAKLDTPVFGMHGIMVSCVISQRGHGVPQSRIFSGGPFICTLFNIFLSLCMKLSQKSWWYISDNTCVYIPNNGGMIDILCSFDKILTTSTERKVFLLFLAI